MKTLNKLFYSLVLLLTTANLVAQEVISIEAVSPDVTITVRGPEKEIKSVDPAKVKELNDCIILLSGEYGKTTKLSGKQYVAVQIDDKMTVTKVVNTAGPNKEKPKFKESANIAIPQGGFVLAAIDSDYSKGFRKFLADNFRVGDVVKLRKTGDIASLTEILAANKEQIELGFERILTVTDKELKITGQIKNYTAGKNYFIAVGNRDKEAVGRNFSFTYPLADGVNYIDLELTDSKSTLNKQSIVAFRKDNSNEEKRRVLWVEQFPNAKVLTNYAIVEETLANAKAAGFNYVAFDVKGPDGFASYRKNYLSKTPYYTHLTNPNKQAKVADDFDLLQAISDACRKLDLKIYVSFNFFTEGNLMTQDFAVLRDHPEWEEVVQRPEDKGAVLKLSESKVGKDAKAGKRLALAFVNPSNKDVCDFQLLRVQEVIENYDIDGIILDRTRYDNFYADFSDVSRDAFAQYLKEKGKTLTAFPQDAFTIDSEGKMVEGQFFLDWITFRSNEIAKFAARVKQTLNDFNQKNNKNVGMAAYVGSWYEVYYQNGVNWASRNFKYDDRLAFPESRIYSDEYSQTSYTHLLDFLMIGTYYKTAREIAKYVTLGNILTNGELPLVASVSLDDLRDDKVKPVVFESAVENSSGLMIFDLCYITDWLLFNKQMEKAREK